MSFKSPLVLLLIIPSLLVLIYVWRNSFAGLGRMRYWITFLLRTVVVLMLVLAMSGAQLIRHSDKLVVIYALDISRSMDENHEYALDVINEFIKKADSHKDESGIVVFGSDSSIETMPGRIKAFEKPASVLGRDFTNIESSLSLSSVLFREDVLKRIVVVTDCRENSGSAFSYIKNLETLGTEVWICPLDRKFVIGGVSVEKVTAPPRIRENEMFELTVKYHSTFDGMKRGNVIVNRDDGVVESYTTEFTPGTNILRIPQKVKSDYRALSYRINIEVVDDIFVEDNTGFAFAQVLTKPAVLIADENPAECEQLKAALQSGGIEKVDVVTSDSFPSSLGELLRYDAVIISSVPARAFSPEQFDAIKNYVELLGGGFAMLGGEKSFALGGYKGTEIEEILPVKMDIKQQKKKVSVAAAIVIDHSGSMTMPTPSGKQKIELANEACCRTVELMDDEDQIIVIYGTEGPLTVIDMTKIKGNRKEINKIIRSQKAGGGGIIALPSLEEAYAELKKVKAAIKHVILFTDAADTEDPNQNEVVQIVSEEARKGITLTVIGMGKETDFYTPFIKRIAEGGQGRFFLTDDVNSLPQIFTEDLMSATKRGLVEEDFTPALGSYSSILEGIQWDNCPPLHGYIITEPKPSAELHLFAPESVPLFAKWQFGLGKTFAFTSDAKSRYATSWLAWNGYKKFWTQAMRWLLRTQNSTGAVVDTQIKGTSGEVYVRTFDEEGAPNNFVDFNASVIGPDGSTQSVKLTENSPGIYQGRFDVKQTGLYVASVSEADKGITGISGSALPYSPELSPEDKSKLLTRFKSASGVVLSKGEDVYRRTKPYVVSRLDIWKELLMLALILYMIELVIRRFYLPEFVLVVFGRLGMLVRGKKAAVHDKTTETLLVEKIRSVRSTTRAQPSKSVEVGLQTSRTGPAQETKTAPEQKPQTIDTLEELVRRVKKK